MVGAETPVAPIGAGKRAVVLVGGPAAPYSRALRIARALAAEAFDVEIAAIAAPGLAEEESIAGPAPGSAGTPDPDPASIGRIVLRRYRPSGPWSLIGSSRAATGARATPPDPPTDIDTVAGSQRKLPTAGTRLARQLAEPLFALRRWLLWPHAVRGWWATLARDLEPADLYHACGSLTIAAALATRDRSPIGPGGSAARVVYDAVDDVADSNETLSVPEPFRRRNARIEASWARSADAVLTVNEALASRLAARWRLVRPPLIVANLPEPAAAVDSRLAPPDRLRSAAGLPASTRIVLFQGRLGPGLGLDEAAEAVLLVADAALVLLGFGRGMPASLARDREARYAGRHVTLPARHPDELLSWTAGADVAIIPLPPVSFNQRLSSPNKFWEAIAAGTPVVVVDGLKVMEQLVREYDLGAIAASTAPADLAVAIVQVLDRSASDGGVWRDRIAATSRDHFGWPAAASAYRALIREIAP